MSYDCVEIIYSYGMNETNTCAKLVFAFLRSINVNYFYETKAILPTLQVGSHVLSPPCNVVVVHVKPILDCFDSASNMNALSRVIAVLWLCQYVYSATG